MINQSEHKAKGLQTELDLIQKQKSELISICREINSFETSVKAIVNNNDSYYVHWKSRPTKSKLIAIEQFLQIRLNNENLKIEHLNAL